MSKSVVAILNPADHRGVYQGLGSELAAIEPPVWARLLASYLSRLAIPIHVFDEQLDATVAEAATSLADVVMFVIPVFGHQPSASTHTMPAATRLCKDLEQLDPEIPRVVLGTHPANLSEQTLIETGADFVCTGEGFTAVRDLYEFVQTPFWRYKKPPLGLCYWDHDEPVRTDPALNISDLDEHVPGGAWQGLPMSLYRAHNWHAFGYGSRSPYASIYTSWGCPFACSFCCIQSQFREGDQLKLRGRNSYRLWSPDAVIRELTPLVEHYGVTHIKVCDEMFVLNYDHVMGICERIIERGWNNRLNIWCYGRVDCTKDKFLARMREAGFRWIGLGIEAASDQVRDGIDKSQYGVEDIYRTCERIRDHGINIAANFIFGLPNDTLESMEQTYNLAEVIRPEWCNMYGCMPYPGSALYEQVKPHWRPEGGWLAYSHHSYYTCPLPTATLSSADVLRFRDEAFNRYYTSPGYLEMIERKFDRAARVGIEEMTKHKLKRKLLGDLN